VKYVKFNTNFLTVCDVYN